MMIGGSGQRGATVLGLLLSLQGCVTAGDRNVTTEAAGEDSLCGLHCRRVEQAGCGDSARCENQCKEAIDDNPDCEAEYDIYYNCTTQADVQCNSLGAPRIDGCDRQAERLRACEFRSLYSHCLRLDGYRCGDCCAAEFPEGDDTWTETERACVCREDNCFSLCEGWCTYTSLDVSYECEECWFETSGCADQALSDCREDEECFKMQACFFDCGGTSESE
jgi:hypothetical protein